VCKCGGNYKSETNPQATVYETLDNGIMPRKVERIKDVEEMVKQRSKDSLTKKEDSHIV
jgi:hypothetical protein